MSLVKAGNSTALADRLKANLCTKYGMGGAILPDTSALLLDISGSMEGWKVSRRRRTAMERLSSALEVCRDDMVAMQGVIRTKGL